MNTQKNTENSVEHFEKSAENTTRVKALIAKIRKRKSNDARYSRTSLIANKALLHDRILAKNFPHSNGKTGIPVHILKDAGFEFDIMSCVERTNPPIFWIINYGYSFTSDKKKIIIYYGTNPLSLG